MDGIHDLGGMAGFGKIEREQEEPVFHQAWQGRAFAINVLSIAVFEHYNTDAYRHAIERMNPRHYLQACYYERVLTGVATLLVEKGIVARQELQEGAGGEFPLASSAVANDEMPAPEPSAPFFQTGDTVFVKNVSVPGHTRVPRYCRGKTGTVLHVAPAFTFPDHNAHGRSYRKEPTYHVEFEAGNLWPEAGSRGESVVVDLWQSYLEPRK